MSNEIKKILPQQIYGEMISKKAPNYPTGSIGALIKGDKGLGNHVHAALNDTDAAQIANKLADMEVKGKKVISADAFNNYVKENYPNVEFNPVNNYISIANATGSLTTYSVQQQAYEQAQKAAELQEKSGQDSAPDMGV